MTPIAILFLVLSIGLVWGGLAVSTYALIRTSEEPDTAPTGPSAPAHGGPPPAPHGRT